MKKLLLTFVNTLLLTSLSIAQSNDCSTATLISVTANCSTPTNGTSAGATQSIPGCSGTADDDVWYRFIATATSHQINIVSSAGYDAVVQLFSGTCSTLNSITCMDNSFGGGTETINAYGLTIGNTYFFRVYDYYSGSGSGNFTACVTATPTPPSNDNCAGAIILNVNAACTNTNFSTVGATQSSLGCAGNADDDVWFRFTATNSVQNIQVTPSGGLDPVVQLYSGTCPALSSLYCIDNTFSGGTETINAVGLVPGQVYYIRVYDYYASATGSMSICVTGTASAAPTNDNPCSAIALPPVTSNCTFSQFTNVGATQTLGVPIPVCTGGSGSYTASSKDVWFAITVPSSGNIHITSKPNMGAGSISDGVMALYSGTCGALTPISCSDDNNYPGGANDLLPLISANGLTPGSTVYLRYWGWGAGQGNFGICVTTATNDNCANALYICDINGYSGSTSGAYTPDRPGNMRGNNEDAAGVNQPDGINTGGIFGQGGPWGTGAPNYDVTIDNNSWIKFTAAAATATLNVSIADCWIGNYPSGGIQMQIFSGTNCSSFTPVSNFAESSTGFILTATGLIIGNDYYLMIDGFAGDICNYTISANSGVLFPDIADVPPICQGQSVTLTAPPGATSYLWAHNGATTQSVVVTPSTSQTYYCEVTGLCNNKQTLDVLVTVKPNPIISLSTGAGTTICSGNSVAINANGATTYSWNTGSTSSSINVSPLVTTTYTVTGTTNGCSANNSTTITVNSKPTLSANPTATPSNCGASTGSLNGAVASGVAPFSYSWTNSGGTVVSTSANATSIPAGTYNLTVTAGNGCFETFGPYTVTNPGSPPAPSVNSSLATGCAGSTVQLNINAPNGSATYNWSGPSGFTASGTSIVFNNATTANQGTYCVTATVAGCTGNSTCTPIVVNPNPTVSISSGPSVSICNGSSAVLSAAGASTYSWSSGQATSSITVNPSSNTTYTVTGTSGGCTAMAATNVIVNPNPSLTVTPIMSQADCNGSNGSLNGASVSGQAPINYTWTNGSGTVVSNLSNASNLPAGSYTLSVTDGNNCPASFGPFTVSNPSNPPAPAVSILSLTICEGNNTGINVTTPNGSANYSWTGPNSFMANGTSIALNSATTNMSGSYCVIATISGCASTPTCSNLLINPNPNVTITQGSTVNICNGLSANLNANGATTYSWSTGQNSTTISVAPTVNTTYTVTGTSNSCTAVASTTVIVNANPSVSSAPTMVQSDCGMSNGSLNGIALSGQPAFTYVWTNGSGTIVSNTADATNLSAGNYNLMVTDGNGCIGNFGPFTVTNPNTPNAPSVNVSSPIICEGDNTGISVISPDPSATYNWTGPNAFSANGTSIGLNNASINMSGNYCVTASISGCNSTPTCSTININPNPVVSIAQGSNIALCSGESLNLTVNGAGSYVWNTGATTNTITVSPTVDTNYWVIGTSNGCTDSTNIAVQVNDNPSISTAPVLNASDCDVDNGSITGFGITGSNGFIFNWTNSLGNTVSNTIDANNLGAGTYNLNVTDVNGCSSDFGPYTISNVGAPNAPIINAVSSSPCQDGNVELLINNPDPNATYQWNGPNGFVSNDTNIIILANNNSIEGNYCVTITESGCISAPSCETVVFNALPAIVLNASQNNTSICERNSTALNVSGGDTYIWTLPNGGTWNGNNYSIGNMTLNDQGWYYVTGTDANGCSNLDSLYLTMLQAPLVDVSSDAANNQFCLGASANLMASGGTQYSWNGPNGFNSNLSNVNISPINNSNVGTYTVTVTDNQGCEASDSLTINLNSVENASIADNDSVICPGEAVSFYGEGNGSYSWTGPLNFTSDQSSFTISNTSVSNTGWYYLLVTDSSGCQSADSTYLSVEQNSDCLLIPDLETPNGDGMNDTWFIQGLAQYPNASVEIYNRWGNMIYKASPYKNDWMGEVNTGLSIDGADKIPVGTYFYILNLNDVENKTFKGSIEVEY